MDDRIEKIYWNTWDTDQYTIRFVLEMKQNSDKVECMKIVEHTDISQKPNIVVHSTRYCPSSQTLEFRDFVKSTIKTIRVNVPNVDKKITVKAASRAFVRVDGENYRNSDRDLSKEEKVTKSKIIVYSINDDVIDVSNFKIDRSTYFLYSD